MNTSTAKPTYKDILCQTELTCTDLSNVDQRCRLALAKLSKLSFSGKAVKGNDKESNIYTGLPNFIIFTAVFSLVEPYIPASQSNVDNISAVHDIVHKTKAEYVSRRISLQSLRVNVNSITDISAHARHSCDTLFFLNQVARKGRTKEDHTYFI